MFQSLWKFHDEVVRDISAMGGVFFTTLIPLFVLLLGELGLFYELVVGLFLVYIVNIGIRQFYFKDRPRKELYVGWVQRIYASTFPSMHAMRVWFLVTVFGIYYSDTLLSAIFLVVGAAVSYSRVVLEKHFYSDVIVGTALGIGIGLGVVYLL
jgi:membrane-associated phospholipid phosphatase